jgi:hypothetical protein
MKLLSVATIIHSLIVEKFNAVAEPVKTIIETLI